MSPPGTPIREAHITRQLDVSQIPVPEALLQVEHLGLVVRVPDRGTTVTKLTRREIRELLEVRRHLELLAFHLAARQLTDAVILELRCHLRRIQQQVTDSDHFAVAEKDLAFHRTVWHASGNDVPVKTLERLCAAVYAFVSLKRAAAGENLRHAVRSHRKLLEELLSRDEERITAAVNEHICSTRLPATVAD